MAVQCEKLAASIAREQYQKPPWAEEQSPREAQFAMFWQYFDWQWARTLPIGLRGLATMLFLAFGIVGLVRHARGDLDSFVSFAAFLATISVLLIFYLNFKYGYSTYAEVPLGDWVAELTDGTRNNYDKLGHFVQGFVPAIVAREILLRNHVVARRGWLAPIVVSICLAISAFYEFLEWWVALLSDEAADAFLGTQGYTWDTQSDMWFALIGAVMALVLLSRLHDKQLEEFMESPAS